MRKAKFLSRLDFRASDIEYQCEVDTGAIFTIICHCSCSHVNVCHSLLNEDFVNSSAVEKRADCTDQPLEYSNLIDAANIGETFSTIEF